MPINGIRIFAHRGARLTAPENTLESLARAKDEGADGVEFDVQLSADGEPFLFHDDSARRVAGVAVLVSSLKWKDLRELRAFGKYRIPHLDEALRALEDWPGAELFIDLHQRSHALAETVARRIKASAARERTAVLDFYTNRAFLRRVVETEPSVRIAVMPGPPWWIERSCALGARSLCVGWDRPLTRVLYRAAAALYDANRAIGRARARGVSVSGGVANTPDEVSFMLSQGVDGIWTDDLAMARACLSRDAQAAV